MEDPFAIVAATAGFSVDVTQPLSSAERIASFLQSHSAAISSATLAALLEAVAKLANAPRANAAAKVGIASLLCGYLSYGALRLVLDVLGSVEVPAPASEEERALREAMGSLLTRLWKLPLAPELRAQPTLLMRVVHECVVRFGTRFVGADTYIFQGYLHTGCRLGQGGEGAVHLGVELASSRLVAIKSIRSEVLEQPGVEDKLNRCIDFLRAANDASIVKLYHVAKTNSSWFLYLEFIDGGDLQEYMHKNKILAEPKAKELFRKLLQPVSYLRSNNKSHRDLKPSNFMRTVTGDIKLVDFATMHEQDDTLATASQNLTQTFVGTPMYMAPEVWTGDRKPYRVEKVDVWSMGVILYELVCGRVPWAGETREQYLRNIIEKRELVLPRDCSPDLKNLLERALQINPSVRMSWVELCGHPWLADDMLTASRLGAFTEETVFRLESRVIELESKCKLLSEGMGVRDRQIALLTQELATFDVKPAPVQEANRRLVKLQESCAALGQRVLELEPQLRTQTEALATATAQLAALTEARDTAASEALARITALELSLEAARGPEAEARVQAARDAERARAEDDASTRVAQLESEWNAHLAEVEGRLEARERDAAAHAMECTRLRSEHAALVDALRLQLADAERNLQAARTEAADCAARAAAAAAELEAAKRGGGDELAFVRADLATRDAELASAVTELQAAAQRETSLKAKVLASTRQVVQMQEEAAAAKTRLAAADADRRAAEQLRLQLQAQQALVDEMLHRPAEAPVRPDPAVAAEVQRLRAHVVELERALNDSHAATERHRREHEQFQAELLEAQEESSRQLTALRTENDELRLSDVNQRNEIQTLQMLYEEAMKK